MYRDRLYREVFLEEYCRAVVRVFPAAREMLAGVGFRGGVDRYCRLMLYAQSAGAASALVSVVIGLSTGLYVNPFLSLAILLLLAPPPAGLLAVRLLYSVRRDNMESKFHFFASTLAMLLSAGFSTQEAFEYMRERYYHYLRDFMVEVDMIVLRVRRGQTMKEAMEAAAKVTPSPSMRGLLLAVSSAVGVGADLGELVLGQLERNLERFKLEIDRVVTSLGTLMEIYIIVALLAPAMLAIAGLLFTIQRFRGITLDLILALEAFILLPTVSIVFIVLTEMIVSRVRP